MDTSAAVLGGPSYLFRLIAAGKFEIFIPLRCILPLLFSGQAEAVGFRVFIQDTGITSPFDLVDWGKTHGQGQFVAELHRVPKGHVSHGVVPQLLSVSSISSEKLDGFRLDRAGASAHHGLIKRVCHHELAHLEPIRTFHHLEHNVRVGDFIGVCPGGYTAAGIMGCLWFHRILLLKD